MGFLFRDNQTIFLRLNNIHHHKIYKSIQFDNFYEDGQSMTFNKNGDLTEKQHTLYGIRED